MRDLMCYEFMIFARADRSRVLVKIIILNSTRIWFSGGGENNREKKKKFLFIMPTAYRFKKDL